MKVAAVIVLGLAALAASAPSSINDSIRRDLATKGTANVLLTMAKSTHRQIRENAIKNRAAFATHEDFVGGLYSAMKSYAFQSQAPVMAILEKARSAGSTLQARQLWVSNQIIVRNIDAATFAQLEDNEHILEILEEKFYPLEAPMDLKVYPDASFLPPTPNADQWGVEEIGASKVHESGITGNGIVVSNIDTGVRWTHQALREGYRQDGYGWYDPGAGSVAPNDGNGHGTHTMGTIAGRANGIGVAKGATWIACKGCSSSSCSSFDLMECGQWVAEPTTPDGKNPDKTKRPSVVSNSWGGGQGDSWYNDYTNLWIASGMTPLFSSGNSGPSCRTSNSPSDYVNAWAVGSTAQGGSLSSFSSVGPTVGGDMKPDISAPGSSVVSAYYTSDTAYATLSGTSMACPHVAGLSALVLERNPNMTLQQLKSVLTGGAVPHISSGRNCGGVDESTFPNNAVGHGIINAVNSVGAAAALL